MVSLDLAACSSVVVFWTKALLLLNVDGKAWGEEYVVVGRFSYAKTSASLLFHEKEEETYKKQVHDDHKNDIRFRPVRPWANQVMYRKLDRKGEILYVVPVCVLLPLYPMCRRVMVVWWRYISNSSSRVDSDSDKSGIYSGTHQNWAESDTTCAWVTVDEQVKSSRVSVTCLIIYTTFISYHTSSYDAAEERSQSGIVSINGSSHRIPREDWWERAGTRTMGSL
jgi:hypothetical protein